MMLRALAIAALAALAGCAQFEIAPEAGDPVVFELSGRIAMRFRDEAATGNLSWRHRAGGDELLISTALGQGVARIVRSGDQVVLTTSDDREYRAADAESLTEQVLGFRLPLAGLADWVRARPSTDSPALAEYAHDGRMLSLEQRGWRIEFLDYSGELPSRLKLSYPGLELRLAISEWRSGGPPREAGRTPQSGEARRN
jgi:outer membrane lipoprotein LolB